MYQSILPENLNGFTVYMIGIKGTGMAALAEILVSKGALVWGSDVPDVFYTDAVLQKLNITVYSGFAHTNVPDSPGLIIYSPAFSPENNEELFVAAQRGLPMMSYPEALGALSKNHYSCGICGVHGKTTTTGITGTILKKLGFPASVLAGSIISGFGNSCTMLNGDEYFIAETCEYKRHFLNFFPKKIVLTGVEPDHQDYYPTYESILTAFLQYIGRLPQFSELFIAPMMRGLTKLQNWPLQAGPIWCLFRTAKRHRGIIRCRYTGFGTVSCIFPLQVLQASFGCKYRAGITC